MEKNIYTESLCHKPEINTMLSINYTSISKQTKTNQKKGKSQFYLCLVVFLGYSALR